MSYTKEEIEKGLKDSLYNILSDYDQESSIISLKYNEESGTCTIELTVHIVEEDNYIGFDGY
jgi:hypothetical protein